MSSSRVRRACSLRPLESYRRRVLTSSLIESMLLYSLRGTVALGVDMSHAHHSSSVLERLLRAVNDHDLEALVSCFAEDYANETPVHPQRGFRGNDQVRRNW